MRKLLFMTSLLAMPCALQAQTDQTSWTNMNILHPPQKVQVVEMDSTKHSGTFVNVSDTSISVRETTGEQTIQKEDVRSVKLMEHRHRLRNTLIFAALGAGAGAGIGTIGHRQGSLQNPNGTFIKPAQGAAIGAVIGSVGGAIIGALWPSHETIYRVKPH